MRRRAAGLAVLAVLLCGLSLRNGFFLDDYIHQASLAHPPELPQLHTTPDLLFSFVSEHRDPLRPGLPWWTSDELKLSFWRPVAGLSHWLDHRLWPETPWLMHLHSLLWLGWTVFLAALAFERFLGQGPKPWTGILAAVLFAVDDVHAWPAMWIANRNALLSMSFGLAALLAHDRLRRDGWSPGLWVSPLCLLLGVLSGESAVSCGAYLVAYALFLDPEAGRGGLRALAPSAGLGFLWIVIYKWQGFGARGSAAYVDPLTDPGRFLGALVERAPILGAALFGPVPADLYLIASADLRRAFWVTSLLGLGAAGLWLTRRLGRDARARFMAFGMLGSWVPASIVMPMNRQLLYASFGAVGLLALGIAHVARRPAGLSVARAVVGLLLIVHVVMAPLALLSFGPLFQTLSDGIEGAVRSLPESPEAELLVVLQAPGHAFTSGAHVFRALHGLHTPPLLTVSSRIGTVELERVDATTLRVRPEGGFLPRPSRDDGPPLDLMRVFGYFDNLFFNPSRLPALGTIVRRSTRHGDVSIHIVETDEDGYPTVAELHFPRPLEDETWAWVRWHDGRFVAASPPTVHRPTVHRPTVLPPQRLGPWPPQRSAATRKP